MNPNISISEEPQLMSKSQLSGEELNNANKLNDKVWAFIDSYFETVPKNLVNHQKAQTDSMAITEGTADSTDSKQTTSDRY